MTEPILNALPIVLASAVIVLGLYGIWADLALGPHELVRQRQPLSQFWWGRD